MTEVDADKAMAALDEATKNLDGLIAKAQDRALAQLDEIIAEAPAKIDEALNRAFPQPPKLNRRARRAAGMTSRKPNPYRKKKARKRR